MRRFSDLALALCVFALLPLAPAHAYLDPASVSMALQVVTGAVASVLLFGKVHLLRIASFFRRKRPEKPAAEDQRS